MPSIMNRSMLMVVCVFSFVLSQNYTGPIDKPTEGYGTEGNHPFAILAFENPAFPGHDIVIYHPTDVAGPVPAIFYNHAFGANDPDIVKGLLEFIAKKGYAVVFVPYQTTGVSIQARYDNLLNGFLLAARNNPTLLDTTHVGFMGWSFGGGAVYTMAYQLSNTYHWGENGRFIYALAQWYTFNLTTEDLGLFPPNMKLITQIFDEDSVNDHRMAVDIFRNINIPDSSKDFIVLKSDTISNYVYISDHKVPNTSPLHEGRYDAYDFYGIYRLLDAMCDFVFNGNAEAKTVALGDGSVEQLTMPDSLKPMDQIDEPLAQYDEAIYGFPCSDVLNPRREYCEAAQTKRETLVSLSQTFALTASPNPFNPSTTIRISGSHSLRLPQIRVYDARGQKVFQINIQANKLEKGFLWNGAGLPTGLYTIILQEDNMTCALKTLLLK